MAQLVSKLPQNSDPGTSHHCSCCEFKLHTMHSFCEKGVPIDGVPYTRFLQRAFQAEISKSGMQTDGKNVIIRLFIVMDDIGL